jgi:hypothetical protein
MAPRTGKYGRIRQLWEIVARDPVALTEVICGLLLVALRGLLLVGASQMIKPGSEVGVLLKQIHVTEARWGSYLMVLGVLQIVYAGTRHAAIRAGIAGAILVGFLVLGGGYWSATGWSSVPPSIVCMAAVYTYLLGRILGGA